MRPAPPMLARVLGKIDCGRSALRGIIARACGATIGRECHLEAGCDIRLGAANDRRGVVRIADGCRLCRGVIVRPYGGSVTLGAYCFIGERVVIYGHGGVEIGDDCLIAMHCRILSSNHSLAPFGVTIRSQPDDLRPTRLGRDVWLGAGVTVLGGVTIGDGCIVGAGAVITKDLPAGSVCHGVPATVQRWRVGAGPH